ncbi:MAG: hypothetical protein ACRDY7_07835 [Acidimicrobiia bacterium]
MARPQRYFDPSQPQTLQIATFLLYFDAALLLLTGAVFVPIGLVFIAAYAGSAYGIANAKKWAYKLGVGVAVLGLASPFVQGASLDEVLRFGAIQFAFAVALVALLVHPESRQYQRIWFS